MYNIINIIFLNILIIYNICINIIFFKLIIIYNIIEIK